MCPQIQATKRDRMKTKITIIAFVMAASLGTSNALGDRVTDHWITSDGQMLNTPPSSEPSPPCTFDQAKNFYFKDVNPAHTCYMGKLVKEGFNPYEAEEAVRKRRLIKSWTPDQAKLTACKNFASVGGGTQYIHQFHGCDNTSEDRAYATAEVAKEEARQRAYAASSQANRERREAAETAERNARAQKSDPKIGMTVEQMVKDTKWGDLAVRVHKTETASGVVEEWKYGLGVDLLFVNGKLNLIQH